MVSDPFHLGARVQRLLARLEAEAPELRRVGAKADAALGAGHDAQDALRALYGAGFRLGLHRLALPVALGGFGLKLAQRLAVYEAVGRVDAGLAMSMLGTANGVAGLARFASRPVREGVLRRVLRGECLLAAALSEPSLGSDAMDSRQGATLTTTATPGPGGAFRLSGEKWMITNAGVAGAYLVTAQRRGTRGVTGRMSVVVPSDAPGLVVVPQAKRGLRSSLNGKLLFDAVVVPKSHVLSHGAPGAHEQAVVANEAVTASSATETSAISVGIAQAALELAERHASSRRQGGRLLRDHPEVGLRLAEAFEQVAAARAMLWYVGRVFDAGDFDLRLAAAGRGRAVHACRRACEAAQDLLGSRGVLEGAQVGRLQRDSETLSAAVVLVDRLRLVAHRASR